MSTTKNINELSQNEALRIVKNTEDIDTIIALSKHPNPFVRKKSLFQMCPCRVKGDIENFWDRVIEMVSDEDHLVRAQVKKNRFVSISCVNRNKIYHVNRFYIHYVMAHQSIWNLRF